MEFPKSPSQLAFMVAAAIIVSCCFDATHSTNPAAHATPQPSISSSTDEVQQPRVRSVATIDETLNPSPPPTMTVLLTGLDQRKRPIRTNLNGTEPPSLFQPCRMDGMVHDPPLQCLLFTLCIPGTIKVHNITGTSYQGANELNECSQFDDACCVPDMDRIDTFLKINSTSFSQEQEAAMLMRDL